MTDIIFNETDLQELLEHKKDELQRVIRGSEMFWLLKGQIDLLEEMLHVKGSGEIETEIVKIRYSGR